MLLVNSQTNSQKEHSQRKSPTKVNTARIWTRSERTQPRKNIDTARNPGLILAAVRGDHILRTHSSRNINYLHFWKYLFNPFTFASLVLRCTPWPIVIDCLFLDSFLVTTHPSNLSQPQSKIANLFYLCIKQAFCPTILKMTNNTIYISAVSTQQANNA